ncbi:TOX high mobility group box family member 4 isoform X2 [Tachyglossus aculeatus]|uniref:TOX high mobility group box family member 4 isoform X2 n=1 Tax=Tachyglossus aculeatus TaxID=9261 RepID=UPI0018F462E2|nr:TOX high mobility group box family member 4 isoform X2 [Tachyglossus aculeatus]
MEFPGGSDNYLTIAGTSHPFLSGAETFHTPSLGDEEFEIPPISLDSDPSLAVADVVGHFDDLGDPTASQDGSFSAQYGVQALDMPVGMTHGLMEQGGGLLSGGLAMDLDHSIGTQYSANPPVTIDVPMADMTSGLMGHSQLTTIDQSELSSQLGLSLGGGTILPPPAQSPEDRLSTTPSPASSLHEDDVEDLRRVPSQKAIVVEPGKKQKTPKKKKKKDPNEPQKPVSAYALFFRDTQAAIKGQNPNATFGEVSKIVASMWDSLGEEQKQVYKRKTEAAKKEYLKALAAYKANQVTVETVDLEPAPPPPPPPPQNATPSPAAPATAVAAAPAPPAPSEPPTLSPSIVVNSALSSYVTNQAPGGAGGQPSITKIIIPKQMLTSGQLPSSIAVSQGGMVTVIPATVVTSRGLQLSQLQAAPSSAGPQAQIVTRSVLAASIQLPPPRLQPPPLQQMPQPPPPQQVTILQQPPPLQAMQQQKVRLNLQPQQQQPPPPPLQIKIVPPPALQIQPAPAPPALEPGPEPRTADAPASPEAIEMIADVVPEVESPSQMDVELVSGSPVGLSPQPRCVRSGCENPPVVSKDWDNEYCSNECVVKHCRDVFQAWVASRNSSPVVFVK